ncbi:MAG: hypothetical protein WCB74_26650 [Pseudolabrys sp.]
MRPTELLDGRTDAGARGELNVFLRRLCLETHALEHQEVENIARLRRIAEEILDGEADEVGLLQRIVDIEGEQHHVLAAIQLQREAIGRVTCDVIHGHRLRLSSTDQSRRPGSTRIDCLSGRDTVQ